MRIPSFAAPRTSFLLSVIAASIFGPSAHADVSAYGKWVNLVAESRTVRVEHRHDWGSTTAEARFKMMSTSRDPFTADNDYAYLRLVDKVTGFQIFRRPVPALSHIWISDDSKYIVGVSNIMLSNPYQLVVFSNSGERLLARDVTGVTWPGVTRSVTNWINWYKQPSPRISIVEKASFATLTVEDPLGVHREFYFPAVSSVPVPFK